MIRTPTTFVVGAGGSHVYGLPLASDLREAAISMEPDSQVCKLLRRAGFAEGLEEFRKDLADHPARTIDEFLETRIHNPERVRYGRAVIAAEMAAALRRVTKPQRKTPDWFGKILGWMREEARNFQEYADGNTNVRFVTFNFDSIIENRLLHDAKNTFGRYWSLEQLAEMVIHVHGALPTPPSGEIVLKDGPREVVPDDWATWMSNAADAINVVQDPIRDEVVSRARRAIADAEIVCFLGFHYHSPNLRRLGIPETTNGTHKAVYGSAMNIEPGRQAWVKGRFAKRIELGDKYQSCLDVLNNFYIYRD